MTVLVLREENEIAAVKLLQLFLTPVIHYFRNKNEWTYEPNCTFPTPISESYNTIQYNTKRAK